MKKQLLIVSLLALTFANKEVCAQEQTEQLDEVVISATKFKQKKEHSSKVIYTITEEEIQKNVGKTVLDLVNNIVGVDIKGISSNATELKSVNVRGGRNRQVLVLIDGVPVSDPSGINQEYDLRLISLNSVKKIEVLKGASSALYGTGATTGVINIILKAPVKNEISGIYQVSLGTNNTANFDSNIMSNANQNVTINGTLDRFTYLVNFGLTGVNGMSSAKSKTDKPFESDRYNGKNGLLKLGYKPFENLVINTFLNYDNFDYQFDAGAYVDDGINNGSNHQIRFGIKPQYTYTNGEVYALASFNKLERNINQYSAYTKKINESEYIGSSLHIDIANKLSFGDKKIQLITGVDYQKHSNNSTTPFGDIDKENANYEIIDPYLSLVYNEEYGVNFNVSGRLNNHSKYGSHFVYDINSSYNFSVTDNTKIKFLASYGTAFITPSTYQLFSIYGNLDLKPEESVTVEAGFDIDYNNFLSFEAVYFSRKETNAFIFRPLTVAPYGQYNSTDEEVETNGIETIMQVKADDIVTIDLGYTYTDKNNDADYIPKHKFFASLATNPYKNIYASLVFKNVSDRVARYYDASIFKVVETTLPSYSLLDFNVNYKVLNDKVTFFGNVTNLLNEDYEDVLGYATRGRNYKLGIKLLF